jgi:mono/diheme cytochrome c family protein
MIKKITAVFWMIMMVAAIVSCKHEIPFNPNNPGGNSNNGVCFESDILPIFQSNCAQSGCHDAGSRQEGYQLDNYSNIVSKGIRAGNASNSKIYESLIKNGNDRMPQPPNNPLTAAQINLVATWINEGAQNTTNCASSCDSTAFAYTANVKPILQTHCLGCHSGAAASGGYVPLDTYDGVREVALFGALYASINHTGTNPMPQNGTKLSDCKIAVIRQWIEAGAPNN